MRKILFTLVLMSISACQKDQGLTFHPEGIKVFHEEKEFNINSEKGLNNYLLSTLEGEKIEILEANLSKIEQPQETYYLIQAKYKNQDSIHYLAIGLENISYKNLPGQIRLQSNCQMKCTPNAYCSECHHRIIKMCISRECNCAGGTGSGTCTPSINFPDPEQ